MMFDARTVARILGGEANGNSVSAPGPGHSPKDRSLSIRINPAAPGGFMVTDFSSFDDWQACRDYVRARLGLEPWKPDGRDRRKQFVVISREPDPTKEKMKRIALDLWKRSVSPAGTVVEY
jgi:putative DNA primase/helicase